MSGRVPKHVRRILAEARDLAAAAGAAVRYDPSGGRHARLILTRNGRSRVKILARGTADCDHLARLALGDLRRILAELTASAELT